MMLRQVPAVALSRGNPACAGYPGLNTTGFRGVQIGFDLANNVPTTMDWVGQRHLAALQRITPNIWGGSITRTVFGAVPGSDPPLEWLVVAFANIKIAGLAGFCLLMFFMLGAFFLMHVYQVSMPPLWLRAGPG